MAQVKIYGLREHLNPIKAQLSDLIHECVVEALSFPRDKKAHRFFPLEPEDFYYPEGRSPRYVIVEFHMIEGRSVETKKKLIRLLYERTGQEFDLSPNDLEISITEAPKHDWGFRGLPGDEIGLNYQVEV